MTKKQQQMQENQNVELFLKGFNYDSADEFLLSQRLDYCSATVIPTKHYKILRSYDTIVAVIDLETGMGYDFLRYVYGYTATSAKHISKFFHYYKPKQILTWRPI